MACEKDKPSSNQNTFPVQCSSVIRAWWAKWTMKNFQNVVAVFLCIRGIALSSFSNFFERPAQDKWQWKNTSREELICAYG